jgi:hypothetical protein
MSGKERVRSKEGPCGALAKLVYLIDLDKRGRNTTAKKLKRVP